MNEKELRAEIVRLRVLLGVASKEATRLHKLIDKLTAATLRVDMLVRQFKKEKT